MVPEYGAGKTVGLDADEYVEERVKSYQSWCDAKASRYKSLYLSSRIAAVVIGTAVPVLVNLDFVGKNIVVSVLALGVAISYPFTRRTQLGRSRFARTATAPIVKQSSIVSIATRPRPSTSANSSVSSSRSTHRSSAVVA
jgi:hypothetical protein